MDQFSFANINFILLAIIILPVFLLYSFYGRGIIPGKNLQEFADKHLLKHLLLKKSFLSSKTTGLILWSLLWLLAVLALAGPRLGYREVETYQNSSALVILLDLSESMNAKDVQPSRIKRAKQEIEDILKLKEPDLKIAIIGFSAIPHLITPLTEDVATINNLLPYMDTSLVNMEGSNLQKAVQKAQSLLEDDNSAVKAILVISDGNFDNDAPKLANDISLSFMGLGTKIGAPVSDNSGQLLKKQGNIIISKIQTEKMQHMTQNGGRYIAANYLDNDSKALLALIKHHYLNARQNKDNKIRYYNEIFYLPVALMLVIISLLMIKRMPIIAIMLIVFTSSNAHASLFKNQDQQAKQDFEEGNYQKAAEKFKGNYNQGVAWYKAGQYDKAESSFNQSLKDDYNVDTEYNLGNALFKQNKLQQAISAYKQVLKTDSDHQDAKYNLQLAEKLLKQQRQNKNNDQSKEQDKEQSQSEEQSAENNSQPEEQKDKEDQQKEQENKEGQKSDKEEQQEEQEDKKEQGDQEKQQQSKDQEQNFKDDKQLRNIRNNPTNILKNQFYIEEQKYLLEKRQ